MSAPTAAVRFAATSEPASCMRSPSRVPMAVKAFTPRRSISRSATWSSIHARMTGP